MNEEDQHILLSPAQQKAFEAVLAGLATSNLVLLKAGARSGRTTILRKLRNAAGGILLGIRQFTDAVAAGSPLAIEEAFLRTIEEALGIHDLVLVDDLHLLTQITLTNDYARAFFMDAGLTAILGDWLTLNKKLVFATDGDAPWPIVRRATVCEIAEPLLQDHRGTNN